MRSVYDQIIVLLLLLLLLLLLIFLLFLETNNFVYIKRHV